ncbi:hypothetical protein GC170_08605 [bacterium]|nr:hypothetical protein [bacterium]
MKFRLGLALLLSMGAINLQASTVLYVQTFENPNGFVNDGGDVNIFRSVNQLYGNQPPGFTFAQTNTVETLLVGGSQAWGTGFLDPQGVAGRYALGMLSSYENDLLGLSFDLGPYRYLNFRLDFSSIDVDRWGGPFVPVTGEQPTFRFTLFDNPSGATGLGSGSILSTIDVTGTASPRNTFDWTNAVVGLDAAGSTNGKVTLRIDLLSGGYAAMDNFVIAASDRIGDVPVVPEPSAWISLVTGLAVAARFRTVRNRNRLS